MYKEQNINEIVENLIHVKDCGKRDGNITEQDIDAINDACNILYKTFPHDSTFFTITDDTLLFYPVMKARLSSVLPDAGHPDYEKRCKELKQGITQAFDLALEQAAAVFMKNQKEA